MYAGYTGRDIYQFKVDNGAAVINEVYFFSGQSPMGWGWFFLVPSKP